MKEEGEGGVTNACICMGRHSLFYRTDWWMLTILGRDEVIMALHMCLGFSARFAQRWIQGSAKIGQWGAPSQKDFFFRSECNSNKPNASSYHELKYRDCLLFGLISQIWQSYFLINNLLGNITFNRSANCTQVSDQCPLGLMFFPFNEKRRDYQNTPRAHFNGIRLQHIRRKYKWNGGIGGPPPNFFLWK